MIYGKLGSAITVQNLVMVLYTVPAAATFASLNINIVNTGLENAIIKLAISSSNVPAEDEYIEHGVTLAPNGVLERTSIICNTGESIIIISDKNGVVARIHGIEESVPVGTFIQEGGSGIDLNSPQFTGEPKAPTAAVGNNTTQLATTAFVNAEIANDSAAKIHTHTNVSTIAAGFMSAADKSKLDGIAPGAGVSAFGGTVTSVTGVGAISSSGGNDPVISIAQASSTVAGTMSAADKVKLDAISGSTVTSVAGRAGAVILTKADVGLSLVDNVSDAAKPVSTAQAAAIALKANNASPGLTGVPTAPTAAVGNSTTQLATTAFVNAEIANDAPTKTGGGASGTWDITVSGASSRLNGAAATNGTDGWFRSSGAAGWYSSDFGVGIYATEAGNVRTYNNANFIAGGNVTAYSDERLKKDWNVLHSDFIKQLSQVKYGTYTRIDTGVRQVGVSAQSLKAFLPEAVLDGEHLSIAYGNAALVAAVELSKEVVKQNLSIETLMTIIDSLKERIFVLESK